MHLAAALLIGLLNPTLDESGPVESTLRGAVVLLPEALKPLGVAADPGPIAAQAVLVDEEGSIRPLLSNDASRALFLDERLRGRPAKLLVRERPGVPYLEVVTVVVWKEGSYRTPEYHCETCAIDVRYPQDCPCCQGPLELRYRPAPGDAR